MAFDNCLENIRNFLRTPKKENSEGMFRVTVIAFEDKCNINCGLRLAELLKQNNLFEVTFFNEPFSKSFLNLQSRNFFDFIDRGEQILRGTHADILVWGYEENGKIRLNFQIPQQYDVRNTITFSLLDSLFIPLSYFASPENFSASLLLIIYGIIIAAAQPVTNEQKKQKPQILHEIIRLVAADNSPKNLSLEFLPYIMNMLGKIYLIDAQNDLSETNQEIINNLFDSALKHRHLMRLPIYYGCIYSNQALLYEMLYNQNDNRDFATLKIAIAHYREAQKFLNRNYPYDYGMLAYHLAQLYYDFWKHTNDLQALRDAVAQLREAEKVYSLAQFPQSWCHIEGLLGYYLTSLGMSTNSTDIMQIAINSYKNQQQIYLQNTHPLRWAQIQNEIGYIYYLLGKQNNDDTFMAEARNYFNSALEIFQSLKSRDDITATQNFLKKVKNYID